jgi:hypothetical protein
MTLRYIGSNTGSTVEVTEIESLSKGEIIVGDGSGAPSKVTVGTNDQVLTADSAQTAGLKWASSSSGGWTFIHKTADESKSTQTLANDGDLLFTATANKVYVIKLILGINADVSGDYKQAFTLPTNASGFISAGNLSGTSPTGQDITSNEVIGGAGSNEVASFEGIILGGDGGTVNYQWAQNSIGGTSTLKKGSVLMYKQLD